MHFKWFQCWFLYCYTYRARLTQAQKMALTYFKHSPGQILVINAGLFFLFFGAMPRNGAWLMWYIMWNTDSLVKNIFSLWHLRAMVQLGLVLCIVQDIKYNPRTVVFRLKTLIRNHFNKSGFGVANLVYQKVFTCF